MCVCVVCVCVSACVRSKPWRGRTYGWQRTDEEQAEEHGRRRRPLSDAARTRIVTGKKPCVGTGRHVAVVAADYDES